MCEPLFVWWWGSYGREAVPDARVSGNHMRRCSWMCLRQTGEVCNISLTPHVSFPRADAGFLEKASADRQHLPVRLFSSIFRLWFLFYFFREMRLRRVSLSKTSQTEVETLWYCGSNCSQADIGFSNNKSILSLCSLETEAGPSIFGKWARCMEMDGCHLLMIV